MFVDTDMAIALVPPLALALALGLSRPHCDSSAVLRALKAAILAFAGMFGSITIRTNSSTRSGFLPSSTAHPFLIARSTISDSGWTLCTDGETISGFKAPSGVVGMMPAS